MNESAMDTGYNPCSEIRRVAAELAELVRPVRIYLYNQRFSQGGITGGFKLCVVADTGDKIATERRIYARIDSQVPFDILLYTPLEWEGLTAQEGTFASKIARTGLVLYE